MVQANPYSLRIEETIMNDIKKLAKENGRSINKEIEFILKNYLKNLQDPNNTPKKI